MSYTADMASWSRVHLLALIHLLMVTRGQFINAPVDPFLSIKLSLLKEQNSKHTHKREKKECAHCGSTGIHKYRKDPLYWLLPPAT